MHLSRLPDEILHQIFNFLPFRTKVRCGRVNKLFRRISLNAISQIRTLSIGSDISDIAPESFALLLHHCSSNLEEITFSPIEPDPNQTRSQLIQTFSSHRFHKLREIQIGKIAIEEDIFENLFRNNPHLKTFSWISPERSMFNLPIDYFSNDLTDLDLFSCDDVFLFSVIGRCPNLSKFKFECQFTHRTVKILDRILHSSPNLKELDFCDSLRENRTHFKLNLENVGHFWSLKNLISLRVGVAVGRGMEDIIFQKLSVEFPNLEILNFESALTDNGFLALVSFRNLKHVSLRGNISNNAMISLIQSGSLRHLVTIQFPESYLNFTTLIHLICACPKLEFVMVCKVEIEFVIAEAAKLITRSIPSVHHKIDVEILSGEWGDGWFLVDDRVNLALKTIKKKYGHHIKFSRKMFF